MILTSVLALTHTRMYTLHKMKTKRKQFVDCDLATKTLSLYNTFIYQDLIVWLCSNSAGRKQQSSSWRYTTAESTSTSAFIKKKRNRHAAKMLVGGFLHLVLSWTSGMMTMVAVTANIGMLK